MYTMAMDVHKRFRTESHQDVEPRFNERFILSLTRSENVLFMDDEMNLLTINSKMDSIEKLSVSDFRRFLMILGCFEVVLGLEMSIMAFFTGGLASMKTFFGF